MDLKTFFTLFTGPKSGAFLHIRTQAPSGAVEEFWIDPTQYTAESMQQAFTEKSLAEQRNMWFQMGVVDNFSKAPLVCNIVWADLDLYKFPGGEPQALKLLSKFPTPTVLVRSGRGIHVYWHLKEPLPASGPDSLALKLAKSVQFQLGGDPAYAPNKLLRVPGTYNFKPDEYEGGKLCEIIQTNDVSYTPQDFSTDSILEKLPHSLVLKIVLGPSTVVDDRSAHDYGLLREAHKYGLQAKELAHLLSTYTFSGKAAEEGSHKAHYVRKTVFKVTTSGAEPNGKVVRDAAMFVGKSMREILAEDKPNFLIDNFLTKGGIAMVSAPPKARKSWCVMQMAYEVAKGGEWLGFNISEPIKVAYVQAELPNWMVAERMVQLYGDVPMDNITFFHVPAADLATEEDMNSLVEAVESCGAGLVIVDPIANFWQGDENSSSSVNRMFDQLAELQKRGISIVLVHHARKTEHNERLSPQHQRGSNVFFARPDAIMTLSPYELPGETFTWADFALRASKPKEPMKLYTEDTGGFSMQRPTASQTGVVAQRLAELNRRRLAAKLVKDTPPWEEPLGYEFTN